MQRVKSTLLNKSNGKWYQKGKWYQRDKLYTGIIFFDKPDHQLEAYEVKNGEISKPYVSPCQIGLPSPIQIDSSGFCNEDEDEYGCGTIPQFYQGKLYQGMSYTFNEGICNREIYTIENGETENQIMWRTKLHEPSMFELRYEYDQSGFYYRNSRDDINFGYSKTCKKTNQLEDIDITYIPKLNRITRFTAIDDIIHSKNYLDCPIPVPGIYELIENYQHFTFDTFIRLRISEDIVEDLFDKWAKNNSFIHVEFMYITGLNGLYNLEIFNDKEVFNSLKELRLKESEVLPQKIEQLKKCSNNFKLVIYK